MDNNILGSGLCPPDTKKVNEIMWPHPLSRDFLGLLALFDHNSISGDCSRCSSAHKPEVILLSDCSHLNSGPVPDAWLQVEANVNCSGVCWPGCTQTLLSPWIPSLLGFPASSLNPLKSFTTQTEDGHCWKSHQHTCPQSSLPEYKF